MRRTFLAKAAILSGAVLAALLLTIYRPSPAGLVPFGVGQAEVRAAPGSEASARGGDYKLEQLKIINLTLQKIHDNYVDPTRIDSTRMLDAMLDSLQRNVAEVMVERSDDGQTVALQVNDKRKSFDVSDVGSPWRLHGKMKELLRFVQSNMNPTSDPAQIEYAAVNGLLSTLDPHSIILDPEQAREMDISTSGKFGGIGIVIGMRNGKLSVIELIDKSTPAARSGLQARDHIAAINGEPTANMTLNEAMNRLRGDPNTKLMVTINRRGQDKPKEVSITRDVIRVSSVESRLLPGNVGYLKLKQFSSRTASDMREAMKTLKKKGAKGWVLDMRWNPGGLLDQAIQVADAFLSSGTIVTTVGFAGKQRDEKRASPLNSAAATEPLVVLVNAGSASASEIVAGALKNLNRAVVVGETTFGKGSVQILFGNDDGSKLKLTIAQYFTPGDISIQSVGIPPDIELVPLYLPDQLADHKDDVRIRGINRLTREEDLDSHLTSKNVREGQKPEARVRYLYEPPPGADRSDDDDEEEGSELDEPVTDPDQFHEDFSIRFARELVAGAGAVTRTETLKRAQKYLDRTQAKQEQALVDKLKKLGIDWSEGPKEGTPSLVATFSTDKPGDKVKAGEVIAVTAKVSNKGNGTAYRVAAHLQTDDWIFEDRELLFGRIAPGETKEYTLRVKVPKSSISRKDRVEATFETAHDVTVDAEPLSLVVDGLPRPQFAYAYQLVDSEGNSDGLLQKGEKLELKVKVRNQGEGPSHDTTAMLRNASGDGVVVYKGRYELAPIAPGEEKEVSFTFDVGKDFAEDELMLELSVYDSTLHEGVNEKIELPVRKAGAGPTRASGQVQIMRSGTPVHEGAAEDSSVVGTAKRGAVFRVTGRDGAWTRVNLEGDRAGFIASSAVKPTGNKASNKGYEPTWQVTPPRIEVAQSSLEATGARWKLSGKAVDDKHVEDVFVIVSNRDAKVEGKKVFYRSNRGSKNDSVMEFDTSVPLWPGNNMVTVVARENNDVRSVHTMYVYRAPGVAVSEKAP